MVKIRLQRQGAKKAPFYHIVVADSRCPRDGKIIEKIGTYNPMTEPSTIVLDKEKVEQWIKNGAKPTDSVKALLNRKKENLIMKEILETIVLNIVENKNNVEVLEKIEETTIVYEVKVEKEDMGKIIGKQGKVAQAIRTLIKSIGAKEKKKIVVKFVE